MGKMCDWMRGSSTTSGGTTTATQNSLAKSSEYILLDLAQALVRDKMYLCIWSADIVQWSYSIQVRVVCKLYKGRRVLPAVVE